jgi:hypothetical protein
VRRVPPMCRAALYRVLLRANARVNTYARPRLEGFILYSIRKAVSMAEGCGWLHWVLLKGSGSGSGSRMRKRSPQEAHAENGPR